MKCLQRAAELSVSRQDAGLPSLPRDAVQLIDLQNELFKEEGRWYLSLRNQRIAGDDTELERILTEAEFASPSRSVGPFDASTQQRFGLDRSCVRVTFRKAQGSTSTLLPEAQRIQLVFGAGEEALVYARREGINATFGINPAALRVLREFRLTP